MEHEVNYQEEMPPLVWLTWFNCSDKHLQLLLDRGASVNALSDTHIPPLLSALCMDKPYIAKALIRHAATVEIYHPAVHGNLTLICCLCSWKCLCLLLWCNSRPDSLFQLIEDSEGQPGVETKPLDFYEVLTGTRWLSRKQISPGIVLYLMLNFAGSVRLDPRFESLVDSKEQWNFLLSMTGKARFQNCRQNLGHCPH